MMAALPFLRRWWPAAVVLALIAASWWHGVQRYRAGVADCEARWQVAQAAAERQQRQREAGWRADLDAAALALAAAQARAGQITERTTHEIRSYYADRPVDADRQCLADERVRAANDRRAAIHAAAAG